MEFRTGVTENQGASAGGGSANFSKMGGGAYGDTQRIFAGLTNKLLLSNYSRFGEEKRPFLTNGNLSTAAPHCEGRNWLTGTPRKTTRF